MPFFSISRSYPVSFDNHKGEQKVFPEEVRSSVHPWYAAWILLLNWTWQQWHEDHPKCTLGAHQVLCPQRYHFQGTFCISCFRDLHQEWGRFERIVQLVSIADWEREIPLRSNFLATFRTKLCRIFLRCFAQRNLLKWFQGHRAKGWFFKFRKWTLFFSLGLHPSFNFILLF